MISLNSSLVIGSPVLRLFVHTPRHKCTYKMSRESSVGMLALCRLVQGIYMLLLHLATQQHMLDDMYAHVLFIAFYTPYMHYILRAIHVRHHG